MKKIFFSFLIISISIGCNSEPKREIKEDLTPFRITEKIPLKIYGDSLKVEYEYRGDTIIQNRIDLKKIADNNFDDSFIVTLI